MFHATIALRFVRYGVVQKNGKRMAETTRGRFAVTGKRMRQAKKGKTSCFVATGMCCSFRKDTIVCGTKRSDYRAT